MSSFLLDAVVASLSWPSILLLSPILFLLLFYWHVSKYFPPKFRLSGVHVVITGGSSGIGEACAKECVSRGADVTLIARNEEKLRTAKAEIESFVEERKPKNDVGVSRAPRVNVVSCDVTSGFEVVKAAIEEAERTMESPVDALINGAGSGPAAAFDEMEVGEFDRLMRLNYLSAVHATRAALPSMKRSGRGGRVIFVSSQAGQLGLYGFTAYSAAKFALRGFAEAFQMETKPHGIHATLAFPPDTDTPGFAEESKTLPPETKEISATSGLFEAEDVAARMIDAMVEGRFLCTIGFDGWMLGTLTAGMAPATNLLEIASQFAFASVFRIVGLVYLAFFDGICRKWKENKEGKEREEENGKKDL